MKGDFTRSTFNPQKHFSSVLMQQGRVQLDSDWNEEVAIIDQRWRATLQDAFGPNGVPKIGGGFGISAVQGAMVEDLFLTPGRLYVDGILCTIDAPYLDGVIVSATSLTVTGTKAGETRLAAGMWIQLMDRGGNSIAQAQIAIVTPPAPGSADSTVQVAPILTGTLPAPGTQVRVSPIVTYLTQPDLPSPAPIDMTTPLNQYFGKTYVAYLDVFQRHVTALEDPAIREIALNGPDTGTRTKTTWQVRLVEVPGTSTCADLLLPAAPPPAAGSFAAPVASTGRMRARATPTSAPAEDCLLPADAGFRRLENQLYRVEIHEPGDFSTATFKWSRDNGSVVVSWTSPTAGQLQVSSTPQDSSESFSAGQWVELTDDARELSPEGSVLGQFVELTGASVDLLSYDQNATTVNAGDFQEPRKARRWESSLKNVDSAGSAGWIALEDGVEIEFIDAGPGTWFNKGDYWLIPARTATTAVEWPNDPTGMPVAQGPHGVEHRYCALALLQVHSGGQVTVLDCRPQFPALTQIAATDVSYDNSSCQLVNATNVQQALDALCKARDLAHHNRLIHGYGIVCGLQVECNSAPGLWVTVKGGYAVDRNGNDVEIKDTAVDIGRLLNPLPLDTSGNGDVSLMIGLDANAQTAITAEPYKPPVSEVDEVFGGTLLFDYYKDCIQPFQNFIVKELDDVLPGDPPITARQEVASAFIDLIAQGPNPQAGQNVVISAKEHTLLQRLYKDLRPKLTSDTFCALFDNARDYPENAVATGMAHSFGTGQQTRVKWRPGTTPEIYTLSNGSDPTKLEPRINRYRANGQLLAQMDPTNGASTGRIVDFAFSTDGNEIYVILESKASAADTLFIAGNIHVSSVTWGQAPVTISGMRLASLEGFGVPSNPRVAAIDVGKGLRLFQVKGGQPQLLQPTPDLDFNASGHLAVGVVQVAQFTGIAFACTLSGSAGSPPAYDGVRVFAMSQSEAAFGVRVWNISLGETGSDGLAWNVEKRELYVVAGLATKSILGYSFGLGQTTRVATVPVDNSAIRLASTKGRLWWISRDFYMLNALDTTTHQAIPGWALPTQVGPVDMALSADGTTLAVLNRPADSILVLGQNLLLAAPAKTQDLLEKVVDYHKRAAEAYVDLLAGLIQYLKDCFCDHLLVKCAECTPSNQPLYLGVVSIRGGKVHSVCNFSGRHYMKTFPTVGYWLSLVPILPVIGEIVETVCCLVIPDLLSKYTVPTYGKPVTGSTAEWSLEGMFNTMQEISALDVRSQLGGWLDKIGIAKNAVAMGAGFRQRPAPAQSTAGGLVVGTDVASARGTLAEMGVTSRLQAFVPSLGPRMVGNVIDIFRPPSGPQGPIALHEQAGQVVLATNPPAPSDTAVLQQQLQAKDVQLQTMQTQLNAMNAQLVELHTFRQQVTHQLATMSGGAGPAGGGTPQG